MGIIRQLDYSTAVLVAAGETIERPASIVKELVENSIDAHADKITVEIQNGGISLIRVSDNGCGMTADDLPMSIKRNATSKIHTPEDIARIITLGFRGEALASVAAVADLRIRSKRAEDIVGNELEIHPDMDEPDITEAPMPNGTTVIVENLFENVPARRKFLKSDSIEASKIADLFEKLALSNPDVAMNLIIDGKSRYSTPGDGDLKHTVYALFGSEFASQLIELSYKNDIKLHGGGAVNIEVTGFIGTPKNAHGNRTSQIFFINGRHIKNKCIMAALEQAYVSYIESSRYPACIMFVNMPPEFVDVNIHPTKMEVKFVADKPVFEAVYYAVRGALERFIPRPKLDIEGKNVKEVTYEMLKMLNSFTPLEDKSNKTEPEEKRVYNNQRNVKSTQLSFNDAPEIPVYSTSDTVRNAPAHSDNAVAANEAPIENVLPIDNSFSPGHIPPPHSSRIKYDLPPVSNSESADEQDVQQNPYIPEEIERMLNAPDDKRPPARKPFDKMTKEEFDLLKEDCYANPMPGPRTDNIRFRDFEVSFAERHSFEGHKLPKYRIIGELFLSYVLVEVEDKLLVIDKHAAHERILFEELRSCKAASEKGRYPAVQVLLAPIEIHLSNAECEAALEYKTDITNAGFDFSPTSYNDIIINTIPAELSIEEAKTVFMSIVTDLTEGTGSAEITKETFFEKSLYQAACKAAIKIGRFYEEGHIKWICDRLLMLDYIKVCPHGRPVAFELTKSQIERSFKRI